MWRLEVVVYVYVCGVWGVADTAEDYFLFTKCLVCAQNYARHFRYIISYFYKYFM